jgi:diguanylate cyclase (GGDEF)-like protein
VTTVSTKRRYSDQRFKPAVAGADSTGMTVTGTDASVRRPFERQGLFGRTAPFGAVMLLAFAVNVFTPDQSDSALLLAAMALNVVIVAGVVLASWERTPPWVDAVPPLAYFGVIVLLRESYGVTGSGYVPLVLLPILWLLLHGTGRQLRIALVLMGLTLVLPMLVAVSPPSEWRRIVIWLVVAPLVGLAAERLMRELREQAADLDELAKTDALTGLQNRRGWDEELPIACALAGKNAYPLSIALIDLDHFKLYNDEHGHQQGDRLLKRLAAAWQERLRATDRLARYGGEEFAVILSGCSGDDAYRVIEELRSAMPEAETCSAGIATLEHTESTASLVQRADEALYEAKNRGRDRTLAASA